MMRHGSPHIHFDEAAVRAAIAALRARHADKLGLPGAAGTQARFCHAVLKPFHLAFMCEVNRGATSEEIEIGVAALLSNIAHSFITSLCDDDLPKPQQAAFANRLMALFATYLAGSINSAADQGNVTVVKPMAGGHA